MISVVMPAYNAELFVGEAVESILRQSFRDLELVVVDDGSIDATPEILHRYASTHDRIRVIESDHEGVSGALNLGFEKARGDWVAVMHADDIALPTRIARQLEAASRTPEVVVWGTDGYHTTKRGRAVSRFRVGPRSVAECEEQRAACRVVQAIHPTVMMRKSVFEKAGGYNPRFDGAEDVELFDRMLEHGPLVTVPEPLLMYRVHGETLSMTRHAIQHHVMLFITMRHRARIEGRPEFLYEDFLEHERGFSRLHRFVHTRWNFAKLSYRRAGMAYGEGELLKAGYYFAQAFAVHPRYAVNRFWDQWVAPRIRNEIPAASASQDDPPPPPNTPVASQNEL